jgi:hypothetical protein
VGGNTALYANCVHITNRLEAKSFGSKHDEQLKMAVMRVVAPFRRYLLPISSIALMMEAESPSETLVNSYQSTRRYNPEDGHLHSHRRENLKPH